MPEILKTYAAVHFWLVPWSWRTRVVVLAGNNIWLYQKEALESPSLVVIPIVEREEIFCVMKKTVHGD